MRRSLVGAALALATVLTPGAAHAVADRPSQPAVAALPQYSISGAYVAGISSGGYMATQLHVAYSGTFDGAAVFAGGPYHCAQQNLNQALYACMRDWMDNQLPTLEQTARTWSDQGLIDPVGNLADDPVYVFHGTNDSTVAASVTADLATWYRDFGASVSHQSTTPAGHAWISPKGPNPCASSYTPYLNDCGIDPEGAFLSHLTGSVNPPAAAPSGELRQFDQNPYAVGGSAAALSMGGAGFLYTPDSCAAGASCRLVIALHGCQQGHGTVGTSFVQNTYLNEYADTNQLVVLYP
ncbi:MAG: extracellular catalytic domain type 2 short-chain-length polyhydroxyalkanoate depolymerase, partial [Micromonosporaceae bacterium]